MSEGRRRDPTRHSYVNAYLPFNRDVFLQRFRLTNNENKTAYKIKQCFYNSSCAKQLQVVMGGRVALFHINSLIIITYKKVIKLCNIVLKRRCEW